MPLTRLSKIKEAWRHPVGHELLQSLLRQTGRSRRWLTGPVVANLTLQSLDRMVPGFSEALVEMAAYQPDGVARQAAEAQQWWKEAVVYRVYPPSFMDADHDGVGDLAGLAMRLPYLSRLGVNTLWLWPALHHAEGGVVNYREIDPELGSMADFEALVQQARQRGMRVVLGLEAAFTSDCAPGFEKALAGEDAGAYILRPGNPGAPPNNWGRPGASAWGWYPKAGCWAMHLYGPHSPDLNWDNPALREEMAGVLRFWLDKGVEGFHLGPVAALSKGGFEDGSPAAAAVTGLCGYEKFAFGPRLHRYLRELRAAAGPAFLAAELAGVGTEMARLFTPADRTELDIVTEPAHLSVRPLPRPSPKARQRAEENRLELAELKDYYLRWEESYGAEGWMSLFLESPHLPRIVSRLGASGLYRGILAKLLGTMLLTLRGTPILCQGQELGLPNTRFTSPGELRDAAALRQYAETRDALGEAAALKRLLATTADHARTPMPWSAGAGAGFTGAVPWLRMVDGSEHLNAAAQMEDAGSVWQHYQKLIALRAKNSCLVYGSFNPVFKNNKKVFCYFRIYGSEKWYVEINLTEREAARPGRILQSQKLSLSNYDSPAKALRPYEANLYRCE